MSFFTHQHNARNNTTRFTVLFIIGTIILPILTAFGIDYWEKGYLVQSFDEYPWEMTWILLGGTVGIVIPVALYKFSQFKVGSYIIAEQLGGRYIDPQSPSNFQERQLINVAAEMAIAANIPAPHLYILDEEESINAFAAGYTLMVLIYHFSKKSKKNDANVFHNMLSSKATILITKKEHPFGQFPVILQCLLQHKTRLLAKMLKC
ncbi:hypothetical protein HK18_08980 [Commensalibacter intestini]|uniref:Peptidase M48 domain-containing protein n=1 Tax=Commensalibacter intestini TaxID=479936 RepID=A0A251ZU34_9PROT|nr:hypothetical protein HK18_08980 [Commensalibacter intestini]